MDRQTSLSRFDWIGWLATIPGIPSDWDQPGAGDEPEPERQAPCDPDDWITRKAA